MSHQTYTYQEERWRVDAGERLLDDYQIVPAALPEWHATMAGAGEQAWHAVARTYAIFPVLRTTDAALMRPQDPTTIARGLGMKAPAIETILGEALRYWQRHVQFSSSGAGDGIRDLPEPKERALSTEEAQKILATYDIPAEDKEASRLARRCLELRTFLDNGLLRSPARSLIQQETHLASIDAMIGREARKGEQADPKEVRSLHQTRASIQEKIEATLERLGVWDAPTLMTKRKAFAASIGDIVEAVQTYYKDGSRELIDGVFTEGEVQVLLRDFDLRKPQYRPDLPMVATDAIQRLFDPDYTPPAMPRYAHRRLLKAFKAGLAEARQEDGVEVEDLDRLPGEDE